MRNSLILAVLTAALLLPAPNIARGEDPDPPARPERETPTSEYDALWDEWAAVQSQRWSWWRKLEPIDGKFLCPGDPAWGDTFKSFRHKVLATAPSSRAARVDRVLFLATIDRELTSFIVSRAASADPRAYLAPPDPIEGIKEATSLIDAVDHFARLRIATGWARDGVTMLTAIEPEQREPMTQRVEKWQKTIDGVVAEWIAAHQPGERYTRVAANARAAITALGAHIASLPDAAEISAAVRKARYEHLLNRGHLVPFTADEMLAIGEKGFRDTIALLEQTAAKIDPSMTWEELDALCKQVHGGDGDNLVRFASDEIQRAITFIEKKDLFALSAAAKRISVKGHAAKSETLGYAWYNPMNGREGFRGVYNLAVPGDWMDEATRESRLRDMNLYFIECVTVHEAVPGHHLQFAVASEVRRNRIRSNAWTWFLAEGWGLYTEELMHEQGFYSDELVRLQQLRMRLWRCARVILDVKLELGLISKADAIAFLVEKVGLETLGATTEVTRYIEMPTQPSAYFIGYRQMMDLRETCLRVWRARGEEATLKRFHMAVLEQGNMAIPAIRLAILGGA
jgi:hypothetical protein